MPPFDEGGGKTIGFDEGREVFNVPCPEFGDRTNSVKFQIVKFLLINNKKRDMINSYSVILNKAYKIF